MKADCDKSRLGVLAKKAVGDRAAVDIEHRVLNGVMLVAFLTALLSAAQSFLLGTGMHMLIPTAVAALVGLAGYLVARWSRHWRTLTATIYVLFLAVSAFCWLTQAGSLGTVAYYFFLLICFPIIVFHGRRRLLALGALGLTVAALLLIEHIAPEWIWPYPAAEQRFPDVAFGLVLCLAATAVLICMVYGEYRRERLSNANLLRQVTAEKEGALRSMREKQRLLTVVCHDIANALTVIEGEITLSRMPRRGQSPPHADLERAEYACNNIEEIIKSVRLMEAVDDGRMDLRIRPVDLRMVFQNAALLFGDRLAERKMELRFQPIAEEDSYVMAEPKILANHVFNNLVSNAIKFSYDGSVIEVAVSQNHETTTVAITDHGVGIPPTLLDRLFDIEANTSRPGVRGEPGTGFGIRSVKSFVDMFGGSIDIDSRAQIDGSTEHGTTVRVHLKRTSRTSPSEISLPRLD